MWAIISKDWREYRGVLGLAVAANLAVLAAVVALWGDAGPTTPTLAKLVISLLFLFVPAAGGLIGADSMAREFVSGTVAELLARPVSRTRVWAAKWLGGLALTVAHCAMSSAVWALFWFAHPAFFRSRIGHPADLTFVFLVQGTLVYATAFLLATQLARRLDVLFGGLLAGGLVVAVALGSHLDLVPAALGAGGVLAAASWSALRFGGALEARRRLLAGMAGFAAALGLLAAGLELEHWSALHDPSPAVRQIESLAPGPRGDLYVTASLDGPSTWLYRWTDSRVGRVDLSSGSVEWLPLRWASLAGSEDDGRLAVRTTRPLVGYPLWRDHLALVGPGDSEISWKGPVASRWRRVGAGELWLDTSPPARLRADWCLRADPTGSHSSLPIHAGRGSEVLAAWQEGDGAGLLLREGGGLKRLVVDRHGAVRVDRRLSLGRDPGVVEVLSQHSRRSAASPAAGADGSGVLATGDDCSLVLSVGWRGLATRDLAMLRVDESGETWRPMASGVRSIGTVHRLPDGRLAVAVVEDAGGGAWSSALLLFTASGARSGRLELGERVRVLSSALSFDGSRLLIDMTQGVELFDVLAVVHLDSLRSVRLLPAPGYPGPRRRLLSGLADGRWVVGEGRTLRVLREPQPGAPHSTIARIEGEFSL